MVIAPAILASEGNVVPSKIANSRFAEPATRPFIEAIQVASASASLRVRLLSMAHARQAASIASAGQLPVKLRSFDQLNIKAPLTMKAMPKAMRRSKFSLKTNHAKIAVNTASVLSSRETPEAGIETKPHMSKTGARIPPAIMAPANHMFSTRFNLTGLARLIMR